MRPLTDEETKAVMEKLIKYIGENVKLLIDRPDGLYCFRLHKDRIYYVSERNMKLACHIERKHLLSFGTCFGKFSKNNTFKLHITALEFIAPYAKHKIWLKPSAEQQFLYGHNIIKTGLSRLSENTLKYEGVIVYSMSDIPLGFGVAAKSAIETRAADPLAVIVFHQADIGEYIRNEEHIV
ncbi:60S ribosome subunit biogenesis protein NIP7 homolog [Trichonephila inaurata madagascariensis]|uniref:60S ribosome subunit biogenesis protein NIP7 homolog n=1 Tax=Trichonephila inaurata madagascariensis TaxID=2747483 RepID=A0A8X6Y3G5_9ARAC|nr:60S ribosome subunit biogenesis protein NIP7 homolog [Trichonephila inaurata madagascariensis]